MPSSKKNSNLDIIIAIMGPTGAGKSSLVNNATGRQDASVGHSLISHTSKIQTFEVPHPKDKSRNIVLVDTPGFDDTTYSLKEEDILKLIAEWLSISYKKGTKLRGIIYLVEITQTRMLGTTLKNFKMFWKLCGDDAVKNVVFATTKWKDDKKKVGERREKELFEFWKEMLDEGSHTARIENTHKSVWEAIHKLLEKNIPQIEANTPRTVPLGSAEKPKNKRIRKMDSDIIIPIMGPTGTGKSSLINNATGRQDASVGHSLISHTSEIQTFEVPHPKDKSRKIVLVDTPGFSDTFRSEEDILNLIAKWLSNSYKKGTKLTGIIYLHDITQAHMLRTTLTNLKMFGKLCGIDAAKNVVFGTTKWEDVKRDAGERREKELFEIFWKEMLDEGSRTARIQNAHESVWGTIEKILERKPVHALLIQEELVDLGKSIPQTEAGMTLYSILMELAEKLKKECQMRGSGDPKYDETMRQLQSVLKQAQRLKIPLGTQLNALFFGSRGRGARAPDLGSMFTPRH